MKPIKRLLIAIETIIFLIHESVKSNEVKNTARGKEEKAIPLRAKQVQTE